MTADRSSWIGPLMHMIRSCRRREKMSKARSPRGVLSITMGMSDAARVGSSVARAPMIAERDEAARRPPRRRRPTSSMSSRCGVLMLGWAAESQTARAVMLMLLSTTRDSLMGI